MYAEVTKKNILMIKITFLLIVVIHLELDIQQA